MSQQEKNHKTTEKKDDDMEIETEDQDKKKDNTVTQKKADRPELPDIQYRLYSLHSETVTAIRITEKMHEGNKSFDVKMKGMVFDIEQARNTQRVITERDLAKSWRKGAKSDGIVSKILPSTANIYVIGGCLGKGFFVKDKDDKPCIDLYNVPFKTHINEHMITMTYNVYFYTGEEKKEQCRTYNIYLNFDTGNFFCLGPGVKNNIMCSFLQRSGIMMYRQNDMYMLSFDDVYFWLQFCLTGIQE